MSERDFQAGLYSGLSIATADGRPLCKIVATLLRNKADECSKAGDRSTATILRNCSNRIYDGLYPMKSINSVRKQIEEVRRKVVDGKEIGVYPEGSLSDTFNDPDK